MSTGSFGLAQVSKSQTGGEGADNPHFRWL